MKEYKPVNGTFYDAKTPDAVVQTLEHARMNRIRLHISLGNSATGKDWLEEFDVHGYVGRSTGSIKIPLLVNNRNSLGGPGLLDHCIVRIRQSAGGRVLWQHPQYHFGTMELRRKVEPVESNGRLLTVDVFRDGELHASFVDMKSARHWLRKLGVVAPIAASAST